MTRAWVAGVGLWARGYANAAAWSRAPDATVTEPAAALLPARLGRRASTLTRIAAEVLQQAGSGAAPRDLPTVFATAYGETQTLVALLDSVFTDGTCSPARFHNSVHNTAGGTLSIATVNRACSTTLSAGPDTVAMALLECFALLQQRGGEVIAVFADEPPPAPFSRDGFAPAGAAVRLSATPIAGAVPVRLRRAENEVPFEQRPEFATNPIAPSLALVAALQQGRAGVFALSAAAGRWTLEAGTVGDA